MGNRRFRLLAAHHRTMQRNLARGNGPPIYAIALTPTTTRCALCPCTFTGSPEDGRERFAEHRARAHR